MSAHHPPGAPLINLERINFKRNGKTILQDIDLSVGGGEIVTLIGPNGAGKSTLVKIALRLLAPDDGVVTQRPGLSVGYVPQQIEFDPTLPLTVRRFLNLQRRYARAAIDHALAQAGADDVRDAPLQGLSGGEVRRVLLARALLRDPGLLIMDEPSAGMDINGQGELYRLIQTLRERLRCGILLVSHDLYMVMAATDRVFCLNRHLCCSGQPEDVRRHPQFLALFGERVASELTIYHHHHDHKHGLHGEVEPAASGDDVAPADTADAADSPPTPPTQTQPKPNG